MRDKRDEDGITLAWVAGVKRGGKGGGGGGGGGVGEKKQLVPFYLSLSSPTYFDACQAG